MKTKNAVWVIEGTDDKGQWYPCSYDVYYVKRKAIEQKRSWAKSTCGKFRVVKYVPSGRGK